MLAIVIPYYKPEFFEATVNSLAIQTNKKFTVYIGNDASSISPIPILDKYRGSFDCQYTEYKENMGSKSLIKQWQRCLEMIENESWVLILGDDDIVSSNFVEKFYDNLPLVNAQGNALIRYATIVIDDEGAEISDTFTHPKLETSQEFIIRRIQGKTRSSLSEYIFKKDNLFEVGFRDFPLAWYSDAVAVFEIALPKGIYTINDAIVYFRLSGLNISSRKDNQSLKGRANFKFIFYMLKTWGHVFDSLQEDILLARLEKTFLNNKKNLYFWKLFTGFYLGKFYFSRYFLVLARMFKMITKKDKC